MNKMPLRYFDDNKDFIIKLLCELIRIPTINPIGTNYEDMVKLIEKKCRSFGLKTRKIATAKKVLSKFNIKEGSKRINLVCGLDCGAKKTLHINCHYDLLILSLALLF